MSDRGGNLGSGAPCTLALVRFVQNRPSNDHRQAHRTAKTMALPVTKCDFSLECCVSVHCLHACPSWCPNTCYSASVHVMDYLWWATCTSLVTAFQRTRTQPCAGTSAPLQRAIVALPFACRSLTPDHDTLCLTHWLLLLLLCVRMGQRKLLFSRVCACQ